MALSNQLAIPQAEECAEEVPECSLGTRVAIQSQDKWSREQQLAMSRSRPNFLGPLVLLGPAKFVWLVQLLNGPSSDLLGLSILAAIPGQ